MKVILAALVLNFVSCKLTILSPPKLVEMFQPEEGAKNGTKVGIIRASYANFGFVPYGHTMVSDT